MTQQNERTALDLIHDLALDLKSKDNLTEIRAGLDDIQAIARYGFDVRAIEDETGEA